jgi:predicted nuclease with RNAse H fold
VTDVSTALQQSSRPKVQTNRLASLLRLLCWKQAKQPRCIVTNTETSSLHTKLQPATLSQNTFHSSTSTLSLAKFIDIYCDGNLRHLIISGEPTAFELVEAWETILTEYAEAVSTAESKHQVKLQAQILLLKAKIMLVDTALKVLGEQYSKTAAAELLKLGYRVTEQNLQKDIRAVSDRSKSLIVQLREKQLEVEKWAKAIDKKSKTQTKTKLDFDKDIVALSKYQGYRIDKNETTVSEYANIYSHFLEHVKAQNGSRENR